MARMPEAAQLATTPLDDPEGLVASFLFDADGFTTTEIASQRWSWRNYSLADARGRRSIENGGLLPDPVREGLLAPDDALHIDYDEGWLHGAIGDAHHKHYSEAAEIGHFRFAFCDTALVSARRHPLQSVDDVRRLVEQRKKAFRTPADLVETIIALSFERFGSDLGAVGKELDSIEDSIVGDTWHRERERLTAARRKLVFIHRQIAAASSLFRHLEHIQRSDLPDEIGDMITRLSHRAIALQHDSDQAQSRARLLQDELMAKLSAESNRLLYLLSVLTAVLLPMTIISGLFGMNVGGLPFLQEKFGFWIVSGVSLVVAVIVFAIVRSVGRRR
ncbi:MAG: CorA family divalent cation transporter [Rhizobiaceae bacterium]